jgi:A/G-specific adenine glycosylase
VDGNVRRVLARLFAVRGCVDRSATQARLWWLADQLLARNDPGTFNQALMELGARICTPRGPRCDLCPLARWCRAAQVGLQLRLPARRRKPGTPQIEIVAAAVRDGECLLLVRRPPTGLLANLWTLPGGEVTDGRRPADILRSRICSLAHARVRVGQLIAGTQHVFSHRRWRVRIYECRLVAHSRRIRKSAVVRWVRRADLVNYPLASVDRKMLALAW